jgi:hypothetical protein
VVIIFVSNNWNVSRCVAAKHINSKVKPAARGGFYSLNTKNNFPILVVIAFRMTIVANLRQDESGRCRCRGRKHKLLIDKL